MLGVCSVVVAAAVVVVVVVVAVVVAAAAFEEPQLVVGYKTVVENEALALVND